MTFYVLRGCIPVEEPDRDKWARFMERAGARRVAYTAAGEVSVSTVFLGLDHNLSYQGPPLLFETMVFGGPSDEAMCRYSTWSEAVAGHARACKSLGLEFEE